MMVAKPFMMIVMGFAFFMSVTVISDRYLRSYKIDFSEDQLYTLSDGSKHILSNLEEDIQIDFYFSRSLASAYPQFLEYGKRIEDMLRTLNDKAAGSIDLAIIDPEPFSENEDRAVEAGLKGLPLPDGSMLYLGVSARDMLDGDGVIPVFTEERESFLEYDLVKLINSLNSQTKPKMTIVSSLPLTIGAGGAQAMMMGRPAQPYVIYDQLSEAYTITDLADDFVQIPSGTDLLFVAHPPALNDDQLFAIDQYVLKGGRALIFLDPHAESLNPQAPSPLASNLGPLLKAWGLTMAENQIVGDAMLAQRVSMGGYGPNSVKDYILWLAATPSTIDGDDPATANVQSLNFASAGALKPLDGALTNLTPLVTSSNTAMLYDAGRALGIPDPDALILDLKPTGESFILAARITGLAKTAFPNRSQDAQILQTNSLVTSGQINVVITTDSDMLEDRFWVQSQDLMGQRLIVPIAGNGSYVLNLADHIMGSDSMLSLRARGLGRRPFDVVNDIRRKAEANYLTEEKRLQEEMQRVETRLVELETSGGASGLNSPAQEAEIEQFRAQLLETRKALRAVKRDLRRDIDHLGRTLAIINIALVPFLVMVFGVVSLLRLDRKSQRSQQHNSF